MRIKVPDAILIELLVLAFKYPLHWLIDYIYQVYYDPAVAINKLEILFL